MSETSVDIGDRLHTLRDDLELSQRAMGNLVQISGQAWSKYERGDSAPSAHVLKLLVSNLGVNPHWLLTGEGAMKWDQINQNDQKRTVTVRDRDLAYELEESGIDLQRVPVLRVEAEAGEGIEVYASDEVEESEEWLTTTFIRREYGVAPERVRTMRVRGNSMIETISPNDRIRVALWDGETLWEGSVYVIHTPGGLTIKRYEGVTIDGHVLLAADNPDVENRQIPQERWDDEYRPVAWALEVTQPL